MLGISDMGHSLLARYQLADFYVGDLPMVECVNESDSNSEEESSDESDEEEDAGFVKVLQHPSRICQQLDVLCQFSVPGSWEAGLASTEPGISAVHAISLPLPSSPAFLGSCLTAALPPGLR